MHWWHVQKLKFKDAKARLDGLHKLAKEENPENIEIFIGLLSDADPGIRAEAARELAKFHDDRVSSPLITLHPGAERVFAQHGAGQAREADQRHVRMALAQTRRRDADEGALGVQLRHGLRARVAHGGTEATHELVRHGRERAAVRHHALDAFGHELVVAQDVVLEVAVLAVGASLAAWLHGPERAHAAVGLELLAVDEDHLAGGLLGSGEQGAELPYSRFR